MNIFYYSVHHILEDDEVRLFQSLGHSVFALGLNSKNGTASPYRPAIEFSEHERHIYDIYEQMGGRYSAATTPEELLPTGFLNHFSIAIVMHDAGFIIDHWSKLRVRPVVWRTIGQGVDHWERVLADYRSDGLKIVRYSPVEMYIPDTLGQEDVIRFYKDETLYQGWHGSDPSVLTFANYLADRYPEEAEDFARLSEILPLRLGGNGNGAFASSIGFASYEDQVGLYQSSRAYLYSTGLHIPYTLNFIEAWMTGAPVVLLAPYQKVKKYFEIDRLVTDGVNGFVCRTLGEAQERITALLADYDLACAISRAGRKAALSFFGKNTIASQWQTLLVKTGVNQ